MLPYLVAAAVAIPCLWLCGDLLYSVVVKHLYSQWESRIERDAEGVRLGCREFTLGAGADAVLLIHGFGDSPAVYQLMAPALAAKGFTCHGLRLPLYGMPMNRYRQTSADQWCDATRSAIRELRGRHQRVYILAHSLGAAVAVEAVSTPETVVDGMALLAPLFDVSSQRSPLLPVHAWYGLLDHLLVFTDFVRTAYPPDLWDKKAASLMREDKFVPRVVIRDLFALIARNRGRAGTFHVPLLMILARHDRIVDNRAAERFFNACAAKPKRLLYIENAGHMLPIDQGWEKLVVETAKFFKTETSHPSATPPIP